MQILIIEQFDHKQILIKSNISSETNYDTFVPDFTMMIVKKNLECHSVLPTFTPRNALKFLQIDKQIEKQ